VSGRPTREEHLAQVLEPDVLDGLNGAVGAASVPDGDPVVVSYEAAFAEAIAGGGSIYEPMSPMIQAAHERRMEILDGLDVGDLTGRVCVDYGVGSWGFACVYPRLQRCAFAVGLDISGEAVRESDRLSRSDRRPYEDRFVYLQSRGERLGLRESSVDLFFSGECIEHIENTDAFLDEAHRVLRPGGTLIVTTPNSAAYLYQAQGEQYAIGPEHLALMSYAELVRYLEPRFEIVAAYGFNTSLHRSLDGVVTDPEVARRWAASYADRPDLASGLVVMARSRPDYRPARHIQTFVHHDNPGLRRTGEWEVAPLHRAITGLRAADGASASLECVIEGDGVILNLWCHDWSGRARITVGDRAQDVDLYEPVGGFRRVRFDGLPPGPQRLRIEGTGESNPRSASNQVIFYQAVVYRRV
jgi:SAM-dependent methyltransferase